MSQSNRPKKPRKDFPLFQHQLGRWCKKVRGKHVYFGSTAADPTGQRALELWLQQRDDLLAGRTPRTGGEGLTLRELCNRFLTMKAMQRDAGEITPRTWIDYKSVTDRLIAVFGGHRLVSDLAADDFERLRADMSRNRGPVRLGNLITRTKVVFRYAYDAGLIERPVRYGPGFKRPSKKVLRIARAANGVRRFEAAEIRAMVDAAGPALRAMVWLGTNAGLGNHDVASLPMGAVDLDRGWLDYPRPKTGIARRCPLWAETIAALREWLSVRPMPNPEAERLVFVTHKGNPWAKGGLDDPVAKETRKLLDKVGIRHRGLGFYGLRHTFRTVADEGRDYPAVNYIMGHRDSPMGAVYRERIDDARLVAVVEPVREWLLGTVA